MKNLSIKNKIIILILVVNILAIGIGFSIYTINNIRYFRAKLLENSSVTGKLIAEISSGAIVFKDTKLGNNVLQTMYTIKMVQNAMIYDSTGTLFVAYHKTKEFYALPEIPNFTSSVNYEGDYLHVFEPIKYEGKNYGTVYIRFSTADLSETIRNHVLLMLLLMVFSWVIAYLLAFWLQNLISKPILNLAGVTKNISETKDYSVRVEKHSSDEIGVLYDGFNNMLNQIHLHEIERDKAELALKISEDRFRKISQSANDAIILLDNQGHVIFWNNAAERIFGYTSDEMLSMNLHNIIVPSYYHKDFMQGFKKFVNTGEGKIVGTNVEVKAVKKDGTEFDVEISVSATRINDSWYSIGIVKDITVRKEAEEALRLAKQKAEESDHLKSAFLANMSHEIRTPMNAIIGFTDLLRRPDLPDDKRFQFISIIHKNNNILLKLIDDLLDISKLESKQLALHNEEFNPDEIFYELLDIYRKEIVSREKLLVNISLNISEQYKGKFTLNTDKFRLRQVVSNLLSNAIKFTDQGLVEFGYYPVEGNKLNIFVKDTGIGIPPEKQSIIFNRFQQVDNSITRKYGGTGLGLAITKGLTDLLGGVITIDSVVNQGTTFNVEISFQTKDDQKIEFTPRVTVSKEYNWSDKLILIVEDEDSNIILLKEALANTGVHILWARDGKPAIDLCKSNNEIDLILMDIQLPEVNGYDATRIIKQFRKEIPIIAQTAFAMENERERSLESGCIDYISKPIDIKELHQTINKYIFLRAG